MQVSSNVRRRQSPLGLPMLVKLNLATTSKSLFAILSALMLAGVATIGSSLIFRESTTSEFLSEIKLSDRRDTIKYYLTRFVGWNGKPTEILSTPLMSPNALAAMLADLPRFWRRATTVQESLESFVNIVDPQTGLIDLTPCKFEIDSVENTEAKALLKQGIRFRTGLATLNIREFISGARKQGLPSDQSPLPSIRQIQYSSSFRTSTIEHILYLATQLEKRPRDWMCMQGPPDSLYKLAIENESTSDRSNLRYKEDADYAKFYDAIGSDPYAEKLLPLTAVDFERFYWSENSKFLELMKSMTGVIPAKVLEWSPPLPVATWIIYFPWLVLGGMSGMLIIIRRLATRIGQSDAELNMEDPGFPSNLVVPSNRLTSSSLPEHMVAWFLLVSPALIGVAMIALQYKVIMTLTMASSSHLSGIVDGVVASITPTSSQLVAVGLSVAASFLVCLKLESTLRAI